MEIIKLPKQKKKSTYIIEEKDIVIGKKVYDVWTEKEKSSEWQDNKGKRVYVTMMNELFFVRVEEEMYYFNTLKRCLRFLLSYEKVYDMPNRKK